MKRILDRVWPVIALSLLALALVVVRHGEAEAGAGISGWIAVYNCTGEKLTICYYNKTDVSQMVDDGYVVLGDQEWNRGGCSTDGACKVKLFKGNAGGNCLSLSRNDSNYLVPGTAMIKEGAYWLTKTNGKVEWVKASGDSKYFNVPANRTCARTKNGDSCKSASECVSGNCEQGVCCNTSCGKSCYTCAGNWAGAIKGVCLAVPYGGADSTCSAKKMVCDGKGGCTNYVPRPEPR